MATSLRSVCHRVGGLRVHALTSAGTGRRGEAIVLVHALGVSSRNLSRLAEALAPWYDVYAPDLPGFGLSENPCRPYGPRELGHSLAAWMHAADIHRAAVAGISYGCQVVAWGAVRHPGFFDRVVLVGPTLAPAAR